MNTYDIIFEALCNRVETGELTLEDAEVINDLAYDRYFTEMKSKAGYRRQKYEKEHDYDPKTKTVVHDGERVPYTFTGGSQKRSKFPDAGAEFYNASEKNGKIKLHNTKVRGIQMDNASFNMKHPKSHEFIAGHEYLGHVNDLKRKREDSREPLPGSSEFYKLLPKDLKPKFLELQKLDKLYGNKTITKDEEKRYEQLGDEITKWISRSNDPKLRTMTTTMQMNNTQFDIVDILKKEISKGNKLNSHGSSPDEYTSDYASASAMKNGKKIAKKTLSDMEKRNRSKQQLKDLENSYRQEYSDEDDFVKQKISKAKKNKKIANKNMNKAIKEKENRQIERARDRQDFARVSYNRSKQFKNILDNRIKDNARYDIETNNNELKLRRKMLDELDKNPDAEYLRKRKK